MRGVLRVSELSREWWPHQESNLELTLRKGLLYPFNYEAAPSTRRLASDGELITNPKITQRRQTPYGVRWANGKENLRDHRDE
jgi:hypothetical protein